MADSPSEFVEELKRQNKALRRALIETLTELDKARVELARVQMARPNTAIDIGAAQAALDEMCARVGPMLNKETLNLEITMGLLKRFVLTYAAMLKELQAN